MEFKWEGHFRKDGCCGVIYESRKALHLLGEKNAIAFDLKLVISLEKESEKSCLSFDFRGP